MRLEKEKIELKVTSLQCKCQVSMLMMERGNPLSVVNPITSNFTEPTKNSQLETPVAPAMPCKIIESKKNCGNGDKLRGIYFIDPEDKEFKETIKNARKKLETPTAMPCKTIKNNENCGNSKLACILEAGESTRLRMGESLPNHHEDDIAGKRNNSLPASQFGHKCIPMPKDMKIPAAMEN